MSAFSDAPARSDRRGNLGAIIQSLQLLRQQDVEGGMPKKTCNVLRQHTIGIKQMYTEMVAASRFGGSIQSRTQNHSDASGKLFMGPSIPLLGKRYRLLDIVGEGTFSQIFKAADLHGGKLVAIKVINVGFHLLGVREDAFLRFLTIKTLHGCKCFVRVLESFRFEKHFCFVMELYNCTLLQLLAMPKTSSDALTKNLLNGILAPQPGLHQPRVVRHTPMSGVPVRHEETMNQLHQSPFRMSTQLQQRDSLSRIRKIALNLVSALCIMRNEGAIHADLKPENCFLQWSSPQHKPNDDATNATTQGSSGTSTQQLHLHEIPDDFRGYLGDFGNSIHISEVSKEYSTFDIQSLPYRAPEVLLGVPFSFQIDVWSLGIMLVELCMGQPLFLVRSREELFFAMCEKLSPPPFVRFAGGKYEDLFQTGQASPSSIPNKVDYTAHLLSIKKLLEKSPLEVSPDLVYFIAGLLHPDPDLRLTAHDAMRHPFLFQSLSVPLCLLEQKIYQGDAASVSLHELRTSHTARAWASPRSSSSSSSSMSPVNNEVKGASPRSMHAATTNNQRRPSLGSRPLAASSHISSYPSGAGRGGGAIPKDQLQFTSAPFSPSNGSAMRHHHSPGPVTTVHSGSLLSLSSSKNAKARGAITATATTTAPSRAPVALLSPQAKAGRGAQQGGGSLLSLGIDHGGSTGAGAKRPRPEVNYSDNQSDDDR